MRQAYVAVTNMFRSQQTCSSFCTLWCDHTGTNGLTPVPGQHVKVVRTRPLHGINRVYHEYTCCLHRQIAGTSPLLQLANAQGINSRS